ncbi:hypothetical protein [Streptomyces sp. S07_1.15]|uniref:hypothetical protein n=1 Tax=Streptomyces sp. S07_1.15 TaxID=2873925 RepID=UPI0035A81B47
MLSEDRHEYERILDEALRHAPHRFPELAAVGPRLSSEQLRTMALAATAIITATAATEYQHYVKARDELRRLAPSTRKPGYGDPDASMGLVAPMGEVAESDGAGMGAVVAVLVPFLTGAAAAISLLAGFILKMLVPKSASAERLLTFGWISGAVAAAAVLVAAVALLHTALRHPPRPGKPYRELSGEVDRARAAWREALLERGILPFLQDALTDSGTAALRHPTPPAAAGRTPLLGYARPGFTSPDFEEPAESSPSTGPEQSG